MSIKQNLNNKENKENYFPFQVPDYRFDQKNEMFKRRTWDKEFLPWGEQLYKKVKFQDKYGYRKLDYALRNAAWNMEFGFGFGVMKSNYGLYSWDQISDKMKRFVEKDGPVKFSSKENSKIIKKAAKFLGADLVGICYAHPNLIYSHEMDLLDMEHRKIEIHKECKHAVVMAVEMDYETCKYSPDAISGASTGLGYSKQAVLANLVATFIRGLGYKAIPCGNDTAISIPLAIAAGLGELGRMGLLITEKYGPRVRIFKVFTDLPLDYDDYKSFGVEKFCKICKRCAKYCPSQAISNDEQNISGPSKSNFSGIKKWYINPEKCFVFWAKNWMDCNNCVTVCPFNKKSGFLHDLVRVFIKRISFLNRFFLFMDNLFGYGTPIKNSNKKFWETN